MIIIGLDGSKNGSGVVISKLNDDLSIKDIDYLTFTQTKKYSSEKALFHHKDKSFNNDTSKLLWIGNSIITFITDFLIKHNNFTVDYAAIEDYSYDSPGYSYDKGEICGYLKMIAMGNFKSKLRKYSPKTIKKFACLNGNADKRMMCDYFMANDKDSGLNLIDDPIVYNDVVDAYYINKMLHTEILIKSKILDITKLDKKRADAIKNIIDHPFDELSGNMY